MRKWLSLKKIAVPALAAAMTVALGCSSMPTAQASEGRTFYFSNDGRDANDGLSARSPRKTLDLIENMKFQPGDRILLDAHSVWNTQLVLDGAQNGNGSAAAPITISRYNQGDSDARPVINGNGTTANANPYHSRKLSELNLMTGAVELWNANNWNITDLEVTNFASDGNRNAQRIGILVASDINEAYPASNSKEAVPVKEQIFVESHRTGINVSDNYVHNVDGAYQKDLVPNQDGKSVPAGKNSGGIIIAGNTDVVAENNTVIDVSTEGLRNVASSAVLPGGWDKTSFRGHASTTFRNNYIRNAAGDGIVVAASHPSVVEYNTVEAANSMPNSTNDSGTPLCFAGLWFMGGEYNLAQYNEVFGIPYQHLDGTAFDFDGFATDGVYQYNYSHDNAGGFTLFMGSSQKNNVLRYNLSVNDVRDMGPSEPNHLIFVVSGKKDGIEGFSYIHNNTFIIGDQVKHLMTANNGQPGVRFFNNLVYSPTGNTPQFVTNNDGDKVPMFSQGRIDHNGFFPGGMLDNSHTDGVDVTGNIFTKPQLQDLPGQIPSNIIDHNAGSFDAQALRGYAPVAGSPFASAGVNSLDVIPQTVRDAFPLEHDLLGNPVDVEHPTIGAYEVK